MPHPFQGLSIPERIQRAKVKTEKLVDHLTHVGHLHESNALVVYSDTLSRQVPRSYAAHTFNLVSGAMHQMEIVRLSALWDPADPEKVSIPTVAALVDHPDIVSALADETRRAHAGIGVAYLNPHPDPKVQAEVEEAVADSNARFGAERGEKVRSDLMKAIAEVAATVASPTLHGVRNLRDRNLAHALERTRLEIRNAERGLPTPVMKFGDETKLLTTSVAIVETLYRCVNGSGFSFEDSFQIARKNANQLWSNCTFTIPSR